MLYIILKKQEFINIFFQIHLPESAGQTDTPAHIQIHDFLRTGAVLLSQFPPQRSLLWLHASKSETLADGTYSAKFDTDSGMFHVNEVYDGRGTLTVKDGKMTLHIVMPSQNIVNLFLGTAEDAQKDGAKLIQPTTEEVTYSDGSKEEVYAFDVPVEALDQEFDLALIGTKGKWYDHKVSVSDAQVK